MKMKSFVNYRSVINCSGSKHKRSKQGWNFYFKVVRSIMLLIFEDFFKLNTTFVTSKTFFVRNWKTNKCPLSDCCKMIILIFEFMG